MLVVCTVVGRMLESCLQRSVYESRYSFILDALTRGVVCTVVGRMLESCVQRSVYESRYSFIVDALTRGGVARPENRGNFAAMLKRAGAWQGAEGEKKEEKKGRRVARR
jgi:hypothetical protein